MSTTTDTNQVNFNPAWMQTTPLRIDRGSFNRGSDADDLSKTEMIAPVFAKHRYGREDILAMMQKSTRPPDGLRKCQFFVEEGQLPIILSILNETEMRLQQNINSSKALSLLTHQERQAINGNGSSNSQPSSPWTATANSNKTAAAKPGSRWSALTSNDSTNGGSGYVKAGMPRGGGTVAGRGGGIAGSNTRGGRFDSSRGGYTSGGGARSRLRSSSDDDPSSVGWTTVGTKAKDESSSVWRNTGKSSEADPVETTNRFASSETNGGFHRSGRGGLTASTASRGGRMGADRFEPDYKRSESHDPTIANDWGRQTSPDHYLNKGMDRINLSHSPPTKSDEQQYNTDNNYSRQESINTSKLINERQMNDSDPLQQFLNTITSPSSSSPIVEADTWYYLDPQGGQHGPYETTQMLIWYNSKFFREDLKCTRSLNQPFTTLGELIQKNGRETPFIFPKIEPGLPPVLENAWRSSAPSHPHDYYESTQRALMEEKRKLEEKQEALHREEMERLERERRVREMEAEIIRKQEELMKVATEREEELERKRRQLAEYEQKAKQEAERRLAEQRAKEAVESRRLQEQMERDRQEYEEKQRKQEEEFRRRQRQAQEEAEHLREQTMIEARKRAVAEEAAERQRQQERAEHERRLQQQQHEERIKNEHLKQLAEAQRRREAEEASAKAVAAAARAASTTKAPWTAPNVSKDKPHILQTQRSLLEIQLEEEKALEEKRRKEQELFELQRKQNAAVKPTGPWTGSTTITSTVVQKPWDTSSNRSPVNARAAAAAPIINNSAWPAMAPATPPPKKEAPKQQQPKQNAQKKQSDPKKDNNEFQKWAIKAIKDLNKSVGASVDPEMFFGFIESVIDPVDVEDYFVTYFGESDAVKEFQKKFLEKRIALRPKQKKNDKDDLSAAQSALNPSQASDAGKKKKKGKGPIKTVDLTVLGFKAGGDPNRINAGEIDTAPPVSMKKRR